MITTLSKRRCNMHQALAVTTCKLTPEIIDNNFLDLYEEYLKYFGFSFERSSSSILLRSLLGENWLEGFCAVTENNIVGFCIVSKTYSPGDCSRSFTIEDLFVSGQHRGTGIGELLIDALCNYVKIHNVKY